MSRGHVDLLIHSTRSLPAEIIIRIDTVIAYQQDYYYDHTTLELGGQCSWDEQLLLVLVVRTVASS